MWMFCYNDLYLSQVLSEHMIRCHLSIILSCQRALRVSDETDLLLLGNVTCSCSWVTYESSATNAVFTMYLRADLDRIIYP